MVRLFYYADNNACGYMDIVSIYVYCPYFKGFCFNEASIWQLFQLSSTGGET